MKNNELRKAALEMIKVLNLTDENADGDKIPVTIEAGAGDEFLENFIKEAAAFIEAGDVFSKSTLAAIDELQKLGDDLDDGIENAVVEEVDKNEEPTLADDIIDTNSLKTLKEIVKSEPEFKPIRGKLLSFRDLESLKEEMLMLLSDKKTPMVEQELPLKETQQQVANRLHEQNIEKKEVKTEPEFHDDYPEGRLMMKCSEIRTRKPFNNLFTINDDIVDVIIASMQEKGYDNAFPIVLWNDVVIDGHTRLDAAEAAGLTEVPVEQKEFRDEKEALEYAIHNQRDRRNLSEAELLRCIEAVDKPLTKKEAGLKGKKAEGKGVRTHKETAKTLGVSETKVTDARTVLKDKKAKAEVDAGEKTISAAAKEVREKKKVDKPVKEKPSRMEAIGKYIEVTQGEVMSQKSFIEEVDILFEDELGGKSNMRETEKCVISALPLLKALGIFVVLENGDVEIKNFEVS